MRRRAALALAVALAAAACAPERVEPVDAPADVPPPAPAAPAVPTAAQDSARDAFVQHGLVVPGRTEAELTAALGAPIGVSRTPVPNRHVFGATDTIVVLSWPDLEATFHHAGGSAIPAAIEVGHDRFLSDPAVRIGARWEEVQRRLGPTHPDDPFAYDCRSCEGAGSPVVFVIEDGAVKRVRFTYYVD